MRGKSAVYPISAPSCKNTDSAFCNPVFYSCPDEVQVTHPKQLEEDANSPAEDEWQRANSVASDSPLWSDRSPCSKLSSLLTVTLKLSLVCGLLYIFICSLNFLSDSFRLIAGKTTGTVFQNEYINNPIVGLMIGILVTVLVQSSSTSTSIIVSMVNSGILQVHSALPMIMGSNIGTSVTNTIVSLTQVGDREVFRRAFAGATVHDMFNWLTVIVLLTIEVATGMLEKLTYYIVESTDWSLVTGGKVKLLKVITDPFTMKIIQLDSKVLTAWSHGDEHYANASLIKKFCQYETLSNGGKAGISGSCDFLFADTFLSDSEVGLILLIGSLVLLCVALVLIVKILSSIMKSSIAQVIRVTLNSDIPYAPWLTGYIALLVGALMTVLVQSSSIFTSTLTPLIGLGLISVERSYPLTLGSNIGTTTTALLASIAGDAAGIERSIQIALVHLFFNVIGIVLFYPIPAMRIPIGLAKGLGNITAKYRWFAVLYLIVSFLLLPGFVFLLSLGGHISMYAVGIPFLVVATAVIIVNFLQHKLPFCLPHFMRTWEFLPLPLRSLAPYDRIFTTLPCCTSCKEDTPLSSVTVVGPTTVEVANGLPVSVTHKCPNGEITLVETRTFYPVAPVTLKSSSDDVVWRPLDVKEGQVNLGLSVE